MAFRSISTNNAANTSLVVTPPAGIVDGDILVAWTLNDAGSGATTWPTGFVEGPSSPQIMSGSGFDASTFRYALKVASGESGNYTLTGATAVIGGVAAFSGRDQSTTPHRDSGVVADSSHASPWTVTSAAFSSATSKECDIFWIAQADGASADIAFTPPTGYTEDADVDESSGLHLRQFEFAHQDAVASGATGSLSGTGTGAAAAWAVFAVALGTAPTAALSGTGTAGISETDVVAGGKVVDVTLTGDTYVPASVTPQIGYVGGQVGGRAGATSTLSVNFALTGGDAGVASATPQAGDLVVITVVVGSQARNPACAIATPAGYTALGRLNSAAATQDTSLDVSYKRMGATPDTSFTLPSTGNIADAQRYTVQVFRNVHPTTPLDVAAVSATGSGTGRPNPGSITPVTAGAYVVICGGGCAATGAAYTAPANYTTNFLTGTTADTNDAMVGSGYRAWTSGAEDPAAYTGGTTNAADSWCAYTIALRPAPTTTPFDDARQAFIDGFVSAQSEAAGWNAKRSTIPVTAVTRVSNTVARLTLPAIGTYDITAQETLTDTVPASILSGGSAIVATPTFTISPSGGGGGVTVLPDVGAASLAGFAPSIGLPVTARPDVGSATLAGFAPSVGLPVTVRPDVGSATLAGFAPSIGLPVTVGPAVGDATLTGFAPTVSTVAGGATVQPATGDAVLTGFAPAIGLPVTVSPGVGAVVFEGFAPEITTGAAAQPEPAIGAGSGRGRGGFELYTLMRAAEAKRSGESKPIAAIVAERPALVVAEPVVIAPRVVTAVEPVELEKTSIAPVRAAAATDVGPSLVPDLVEPEPYSDEAIESLRARLRAAEARKAEIESRRADVFALGKKEPEVRVSPVALAAQLAQANRLAIEDEELAYVLLIAA